MARERLVLKDAKFVGEPLGGRTVSEFYASGCYFERCDFRKLKAKQVVPGHLGVGKPSTFVDCVFDESTLTLGSVGYGRFERCSFQAVDLRDWFWSGVDLVDCRFSGRLRRGVIKGSDRDSGRRNEIRGNDFSALELVDVDFRGGVDLTAQTLPPGTLLIRDLPSTLVALRSAIMGWDDLEARREALVFVQLLQTVADTGQSSAVFTEDWERPQREYAAMVADLIRQIQNR